MREDSLCPYCRVGIMEVIEADEPWHDEYLMCSDCQSTMCLAEEDIDGG